jgi:hypothetical protein
LSFSAGRSTTRQETSPRSQTIGAANAISANGDDKRKQSTIACCVGNAYRYTQYDTSPKRVNERDLAGSR